jgi:hypothetical protein
MHASGTLVLLTHLDVACLYQCPVISTEALKQQCMLHAAHAALRRVWQQATLQWQSVFIMLGLSAETALCSVCISVALSCALSAQISCHCSVSPSVLGAVLALGFVWLFAAAVAGSFPDQSVAMSYAIVCLHVCFMHFTACTCNSGLQQLAA